ncbi:hypothetical protein O3P69_019493 [Scylla paramamosain]|uniref:Uncharacterized protein n=1 Tax=Scylla paramamosain TaxID=85552 RepID=A0AAW0SVZ1_SCYPA
MLATMATLMMPAPAPTMAMNPPTLPLTPAKHENALKAAAHTNNNGQKQVCFPREFSFLVSLISGQVVKEGVENE